jgi:hypothetical protein
MISLSVYPERDLTIVTSSRRRITGLVPQNEVSGSALALPTKIIAASSAHSVSMRWLGPASQCPLVAGFGF